MSENMTPEQLVARFIRDFDAAPEYAAAVRDILASKDREIAELRKQLSAEKCELRWAYGEAQETDVEKCAWKQRAQQAESERDEARECVGRLYKMMTKCVDDLADVDLAIDTEVYIDAIRDRLLAALAATPEHLRK
jgi:hypothetical protein